jgi:hypothetical protein
MFAAGLTGANPLLAPGFFFAKVNDIQMSSK